MSFSKITFNAQLQLFLCIQYLYIYIYYTYTYIIHIPPSSTQKRLNSFFLHHISAFNKQWRLFTFFCNDQILSHVDTWIVTIKLKSNLIPLIISLWIRSFSHDRFDRKSQNASWIVHRVNGASLQCNLAAENRFHMTHSHENLGSKIEKTTPTCETFLPLYLPSHRENIRANGGNS